MYMYTDVSTEEDPARSSHLNAVVLLCANAQFHDCGRLHAEKAHL